MASLVSLQGNGGGRIPMDNGISLDVSRHQLAEIIESMPTAQCREMHLAVRRGDSATAQRLLREAAATYGANCSSTDTPAAPPASTLDSMDRLRDTRASYRS